MSETPILNLLLQYSTRATSDPRDRVYSLLGLAGDTDRMALQPDYSTSNEARELFIKTAIHVIQTDEQAIELLHYASPLSNEKLLLDAPCGSPGQLELLNRFKSLIEGLGTAIDGVDITIPSWVPQWEPSVRISLTGMGFRAAGDSKPAIQVTHYERGHPVRIRGVRLGNISMVASVDFFDLIHVLNLKSSRGCGISKNYSKIFTPYPTGERFSDILRRTLLCDSILGSPPQRARDTYKMEFRLFGLYLRAMSLPSFLGFWNTRRTTLAPIKLLANFLASIGAMSKGRQLAIIEQRWLAMVPIEAYQTEDIVVIFFGAGTPFVLRPIGTNCHQLLGSCYVHGVMDGELVKPHDTPEEVNIDDLPQQDFVIF
jgi:hypothetical protein